ncbi:WXG100 family type VII secretion target [Microbacterium sp. EYE_5]|uniref:WXG100 family type VII secretion target n=1 Tax=unclassified Microbacterium TaxID=2609290 RepID=UPI002002DFE2|nr:MULTISPECIES: WXG100 family type VII secretion target [unclassified Microbacterium]MCK6081349.1 WXG100 family type VII secretion target [Microbacterium sp. EYE_382]MCK6086619.1 WXG100 family type VII secretion target [Microbacterium sp. EYE_384]MCK6123883.1 WXG100 family type VII secretion target [Microbacterium sp. EYE_80]MCK6126792.1 WXG100 family type VII secretion target [Microbacterium sp. EYE_79]MCK6142304.1 WXG100 family type VII secretion target [Microbacterium sp. EYE_39]
MTAFTVDSDAVLAATATIRATGDRVQAETASMLGQLTQLQGSWSGSASIAFQSVVERWRAAQRELDAALGDISMALGAAGQQYAQTELAAAGMFR